MNNATVILKINGARDSHEAIESVLKVKATSIHLKGAPRAGEEGARPYKEDQWSLMSPLPEENDLKDHLCFFRDLFKEHEELIDSLKSKGATLNILCAILTNSPVVAFVFPAPVTNVLSKMGVTISVIVTNAAVSSASKPDPMSADRIDDPLV